jgi:hypothetical protein
MTSIVLVENFTTNLRICLSHPSRYFSFDTDSADVLKYCKIDYEIWIYLGKEPKRSMSVMQYGNCLFT